MASTKTARKVEILSPGDGEVLSSPLAVVRVRYDGVRARSAVIRVGDVEHVVELEGASGEIRENVTLLEGRNEIRASVGRSSHRASVELARSSGIAFVRPDLDAKIGTRATELAATYDGASCPAGVIAVNGFMQQFSVAGERGAFSEQVVLRPGPNHLAVQIGDIYATRLVTGTFNPAKLLVTLVWDTPETDLDLYVTEPSGSSVWYRQKTVKGGGNLDVDRMHGYGPENYSVGMAGKPLAPGRYRVRVHYFADRGIGRTEWTARAIADESTPGQKRRTFYGILDRSSTDNAEPGQSGPDWSEVCVIAVAESGEVTFERA